MASDHSFRFIVLEAEFKTGIGGEKYSCKILRYCIELNVSISPFSPIYSSVHEIPSTFSQRSRNISNRRKFFPQAEIDYHLIK